MSIRVQVPDHSRPSAKSVNDSAVSVYTTVPGSKSAEPRQYFETVRNISRWTEAAGCRGSLIYTDNRLLDPWVVAAAYLECSESARPLVAVQPLYSHPFAMAKTAASLWARYGRLVDLNFVAGGFPLDLLVLGDDLDHDARYDRLREFAAIVISLLSAGVAKGDAGYYRVSGARFPAELVTGMPRCLVSGSSEAGRACAAAIGAVPIRYPEKHDGEIVAPGTNAGGGIRIGILAREDSASAWREALARFPEDRQSARERQLMLKVTDSQWQHQLAQASFAADRDKERPTYWLGPFMNYKTFCPYLVGSYADVGEYLARYLTDGLNHLILDVPAHPEDIDHALKAVSLGLRARANALLH